MRVLVAEDDPALGQLITSALAEEGYVVDLAVAGNEASRLGRDEDYDLVVLDLGLPEVDGLSVLGAWRRQGIGTPVLILTARDGWSDRVDGLDAGADDYVTKPFQMPELTARIRAVLRRAKGRRVPTIDVGEISFDTRSRRVLRCGEPVELTAQEISVLSYLLNNRGRFVSKSELAGHLYDGDVNHESNTIAVFILRLRQKLGSSMIETGRGLGYRISDQG